MNKQFITILSLLLTGCHQVPNRDIRLHLDDATEIQIKQTSQLQIFDTEKANTVSAVELEKRIKRIRYIPLDSKELIGEIRKMIVTDNRIYIMDSYLSQAIFVFDKQGKLLFCIDQKGSGPEEYVSVWDMDVNEKKQELLLNDALGLSYIYYSTIDGHFIRKEKAIPNCYVAKENEYYINVLSNGQDYDSTEDWQVLVSRQDSVLQKGFQLASIQKNDYIRNTLIRNHEKKLLYTPTYSDTTYILQPDGTFTPRYIVKQAKSVWEKRNQTMHDADICRLIKDNGYTKYYGNLLDSPSFTFFSLEKEYNGFIIQEPYFFAKREGELYQWDITDRTQSENIRDVLIPPIAVYKDAFYGILNPQKPKLNNHLSPHLTQYLTDKPENRNPIVVEYELN